MQLNYPPKLKAISIHPPFAYAIGKDSGARVLTKVTLEGEYPKYEPKPASRIRSRKLEPVIERRTGGYHH